MHNHASNVPMNSRQNFVTKRTTIKRLDIRRNSFFLDFSKIFKTVISMRADAANVAPRQNLIVKSQTLSL
jgi:hypothetical protein